ncbi:MAG: hypothetical protein KJT03_24235, partial [Verrucomicrobiae bacterium]|nr:hypothetical protein [Verrucomicrobiae bacterium]
MATDLAQSQDLSAAPVLYARGVASAGSQVANQVQLVGVTNAFWQFAPEGTEIPLENAQVAVNQVLAERLGIGDGDTVIVRFQKPGVIGGNAPVAGADDSLESIRCTVKTIVDDESFGRFSLEKTQVPQPSIFIPLELLQSAFEFEGRSNMILIKTSLSTEEIKTTLEKSMKLADYQLNLEWLDAAQKWEIKSDRVFIDGEVGKALTQGIPAAEPVTSYLVNDIRLGDRSTPYSIGSAVDPRSVSFLPDDLGADEIVLNSWIGDDLQARVGDSVQLTYFQSGPAGLLVEQSSSYKVRSIIPLEGLAADRSWMPNFPGISEAEVPSDWDAGLPLDLERIRDKDEEYWEKFRG